MRARRTLQRRLVKLVSAVAVAGLVLGGWPYSSYVWCGWSPAATRPTAMRIGLYEEFPTPERLAKLAQVDFPVAVALAAESWAAFETIRDSLRDNPYVETIYYWPTLTPAEGYYPGPWSAGAALRRVAAEIPADAPVLWDLELPRWNAGWAPGDWLGNRAFIDAWWRAHGGTVAVWRSFTFLGLDSPILRLAGLNVEASAYPNVRLHLDMYASGAGWPAGLVARVLRCGVERYGGRFVPNFGSLDDGLGSGPFVSAEAVARDLRLAREAGVSEVWLFGVNGLNAEYLAAVRAALGD